MTKNHIAIDVTDGNYNFCTEKSVKVTTGVIVAACRPGHPGSTTGLYLQQRRVTNCNFSSDLDIAHGHFEISI